MISFVDSGPAVLVLLSSLSLPLSLRWQSYATRRSLATPLAPRSVARDHPNTVIPEPALAFDLYSTCS
jgi:hypothetical protein